jgi:predicted ribosome quality control (RQC) complex YloA/Tae2 family protein
MHEDALAGARIERIDGPARDLFALTLHSADVHGCLLLRTAEDRASWSWVRERPRGAPASAFVMLMRKYLAGGRVSAIVSDAASVAISIARGAESAELRLERAPANLLLIARGVVVGALRRDPRAGKPWTPPPIAEGPPLALDRDDLASEARQDDRTLRVRLLLEALDRRKAKLRRRLDAIGGDLRRAGEAEAWRHRAGLLLANLASVPRGASEATVLDYAMDPPAPISIPIDPARDAKAEAEALFRKARKLDRGAEIARSRLELTEREIAVIDRLAAEARSHDSDLDRVEREAGRAGARPREKKKEAKTGGTRRAYRTFRSENDRPILVGRSAADNDVLTLKIARPHDHWLHARGARGSHVVVPLEKNETCPPGMLADAAHLAAHFSALRGETRVEITHVSRQHVRKPKGAKAGAVTIAHEKVLVLRLEPERLSRLLESEDQG